MPFMPDNQPSSGFVPDAVNPATSAIKAKKMQFSDIYKDVLAEQNKKNEQADALQKLLGMTMPPEEAAKTARGLAQDRLGTQMAKLKQMDMPHDPDIDLKLALTEAQDTTDSERAKLRSQELIHDRMAQYVGEVQDEIQAGYDFRRWNAEAERLREKFKNKAYRAWERGSVNVVGGGLHLLEELTAIAQKLGGSMDPKGQQKAIEEYGDMARMYHKVLDTPEMQQVVDHTWEKYLLGGIETAPYIVASAAPALLTGGAAAPSAVGSFLTSYAVESNSAYQSAVDRGDPNARARGIATGLINAGIEVAGGGGKKYLDNAVETVVGKLGKLKHFGKKTLHTALKEGLMEEVPQEVVTMVIGGDMPLKKDGSVDWDSVATRLMDTAVAGILIGGVLEAPFAARHAINMPTTPKQAVAEAQQQDAAALDKVKVDSGTEGMTGFDDRQNVGVPDYIAPVDKKTTVPTRDKQGSRVVEDKPAVVVTNEGEVRSQQAEREKTIQKLTTDYIEGGMNPDKALAWAEKTVGDEMPGVDKNTPKVVYYQPPQRHLENIPNVDPPPLQVTDKETAEALAEKYGITGQEALRIMKEQRTGAPNAPQTEADTLSESLEVQDKISKRGTPTERLNRRGFYKLVEGVQDTASGFYNRFMRMDRLMEVLDGHTQNGPIRKAIWSRLRAASLGRKQATAEGWERFKTTLSDMGVDINNWVSKVETIAPGIKLTKSQQIGVAMLSSNQHGRRYLIKGMKISEDAIGKVWTRVLTDPDLRAVMNWMKGEYQRKWSEIYDAAIQAGIDPKLLQQEKDYFPIMHLSKDAVMHPRDVMSLITDRLAGAKPDAGIIKHRQHGAEGEIELDAFSTYLNNLAITENFKFMAPAASKVNEVVGNPRFRKALNKATFGNGTRIMDKFVKDTVRGTSGDKMDWFSRHVRHVRRNVKMYFIGYKVLTGARQIISTLNGFTPSPLVVGEYAKLTKQMAGNWKAYEQMREQAEEKSKEVKYRAWDRDIKRKFTSEDAKDYLIGNQRFDKRAVKLMRKIDKFTVVTVWTSLYNHAKANRNMNESEAIEFADTWIGKTQPMADPEYLPDFFRGSEISKALTDFQQMPNQTWNTVTHDIIGERRAGKITNTEAMYRLLVSVILPSLVLGAISRGRPQKNPDEFVTDLVMYPINAVPLAGPWLGKLVRGWDSSSNLATIPLEEMKRLADEIQQRDVPGIAKRTATTVGSLTGKIPHQAILTISGAYDLATGETKDPRRLLWSEYQLRDNEKSGSSESNRTAARRSSRRLSR